MLLSGGAFLFLFFTQKTAPAAGLSGYGCDV
jgi:hypothetical protein